MYGITIDHHSGVSLTRQICGQLRAVIESGELKSGAKLPPTRKIAEAVNVNRNVMVEVYEQLAAEGYLVSRVGSGTFVADGIGVVTRAAASVSDAAVKEKSKVLDDTGIIGFYAGIPDFDSMPFALWGKYLKQAAETLAWMPSDDDYMGDRQLRKMLSAYLFRVKGIRCEPEQIMIVSGTSQAMLLAAHAFRDSFPSVYIEEPTIDFTRDIFRSVGYAIKPVRVDESGMRINEDTIADMDGLMIVTPSHQFPTGTILSIQRRLKAVDLAEKGNAYIIEDDYDSEFRFKGMPVPPLQTLSPPRVIHMGTFSKLLFPEMRLGYMVLPKPIVGRLVEMKTALNLIAPAVEQRALALFIADGCLDRHTYKMKKIYKRRHAQLIRLLNAYFGSEITVIGDESGMHIQAVFLKEADWERAKSFGVKVESLEDYCCIKGANRNRIVLGYGNTHDADLEEGVKRLKRFVDSL